MTRGVPAPAAALGRKPGWRSACPVDRMRRVRPNLRRTVPVLAKAGATSQQSDAKQMLRLKPRAAPPGSPEGRHAAETERSP
jgi:hypothetical protein